MKIWLCVVSVLCWVNVAFAQVPQSPLVPLNDSAYQELFVLEQAGLLGDARYFNASDRSLVRYQFAIAVVSSLKGMFSRDYASNESTRAQVFRSNPETLSALLSLLTKFTPEIEELGITRKQIEFAQKELSAIRLRPPATVVSVPFADVPKTHWAFNAVESLRQSGIVIGFPDNTFTKQRPQVPGGN